MSTSWGSGSSDDSWPTEDVRSLSSLQDAQAERASHSPLHGRDGVVVAMELLLALTSSLSADPDLGSIQNSRFFDSLYRHASNQAILMAESSGSRQLRAPWLEISRASQDGSIDPLQFLAATLNTLINGEAMLAVSEIAFRGEMFDRFGIAELHTDFLNLVQSIKLTAYRLVGNDERGLYRTSNTNWLTGDLFDGDVAWEYAQGASITTVLNDQDAFTSERPHTLKPYFAMVAFANRGLLLGPIWQLLSAN